MLPIAAPSLCIGPDPVSRSYHVAMSEAAELLEQSAAARAAGDVPAARAALVAAFRAARATEDLATMTAAALGLTTVQGFGLHPGQAPAYLHETLLATVEPAARVRLLAGLARAWVYGGEAERAVAFSEQALALATDLTDDPGDQVTHDQVLADALDAALLAHWGPDDLEERVSMAARLEALSAHLPEPEARLTAALWRFTTAWECLDVVAVSRQLRSLELLEQESGSPRVAFFARSRRAMHALVVGSEQEAADLVDEVSALGEGLGEADVAAVTHSLRAELLRRRGDVAALATEVEDWEAVARESGVPSLLAQAAYYCLHAGQPERAGDLVDVIPALEQLPADVDLLLTASMVQYVASRTGRPELAARAVDLLAPYAGRAVLNAAAVTFHGVVDEYVGELARASAAYRRIGARWWAQRCTGATSAAAAPRRVHLRRAEQGWVLGDEGSLVRLPDLRGLHHLRTLVARPGVEVDVLELVGTPVRADDVGPVLDAQAKRAYRTRLAEIDADLDEASSWADVARHERALLEREALLDQLAAAVGLAGRDRRPGATSERARMAVRKALTAVLRRVEEADPALARLLRDGLRTGLTCRWEPDPGRPVTWVLDD